MISIIYSSLNTITESYPKYLCISKRFQAVTGDTLEDVQYRYLSDLWNLIMRIARCVCPCFFSEKIEEVFSTDQVNPEPRSLPRLTPVTSQTANRNQIDEERIYESPPLDLPCVLDDIP